MNLIPEQSKVKTGPRQNSVFASSAKSLIATAIVLACLWGGSSFWGGANIFAAPQHDAVLTQTQINERFAAFNALPPIVLDMVQNKDIANALNGMGLSSDAKQALEARISSPAVPSVHARNSVKLAWLTLWDTDAQDGDVVQIDSQGYSRTVVLTKAPLTFAIPVPADGVVRVTGIKDGDGGGITVGLASGGSQAAFPPMSEGEALGLKVRVP